MMTGRLIYYGEDWVMRYLILIFRDYSYPYLDRVLTDVKMAGIELIPFLIPSDEERAGEMLAGMDREHAYILTDCGEGAGLSRRYDVGFLYCDISGNGDRNLQDTEYTQEGSDEEGFSKVSENAAGAQCVICGFDEINADFIIKMYQRYHHLPWTILSTERLILREMTVDDVDRLYEIYDGEGITDHTEPLYEDRQQEIEYTKDYIKNMYEFCGYGLWLVVEKEGGRVVGRAGITGREGYDEAELGYVIEKERQRRGYALEACRAVIGYAKDVLEMKGLNCFVRPGNEASVKLCKLLGFEYIEDTELSGIEMIRFHLSL